MGMRLPASAPLNNNRAVWQAWKLILPACSRTDGRPLHQESQAARRRDRAEAMLVGGAGSARQEQGKAGECRAGGTEQEWKQKSRATGKDAPTKCEELWLQQRDGKAWSCSQPLTAVQQLWPSRRSDRRAPMAAHAAALPHGTRSPPGAPQPAMHGSSLWPPSCCALTSIFPAEPKQGPGETYRREEWQCSQEEITALKPKGSSSRECTSSDCGQEVIFHNPSSGTSGLIFPVGAKPTCFTFQFQQGPDFAASGHSSKQEW